MTIRFKCIRAGRHVSSDGAFKIILINDKWKVFQGSVIWSETFDRLDDAKSEILRKGYGVYV